MIEKLLTKNFNILASSTTQLNYSGADSEVTTSLINFVLKNLNCVFELQKIVYNCLDFPDDEDEDLIVDCNFRIDAVFLVLEDSLDVIHQLIRHDNEHLIIASSIMSIRDEIYEYEKELTIGFLTNVKDLMHIEIIVESKTEFLSFLKTLDMFLL